MGVAVERTKVLERREVPINDLIPNPLNPNEMTDEQFNLLYDNIERVGITDPILVRPHPEHEGKYRIIGGEHRWEVAKLHSFETVPCTIVDDPDFDEDHEKFQLVRHNVIHGSMSPQKFMGLYESLTKKYSEEVAAESFGFVDEEEFRKLVGSVAKQLPNEMQGKFQEAAAEITTIDGLASLLNKMFAEYGDSLPWGYMIVDYGGRNSVWLRMDKKQFAVFRAFAEKVKGRKRTLDDVVHAMLESIGDDDLDALCADLPEFEEAAAKELPTLDFLDG